MNNSKRDKLPSGNVLRRRRNAITGYWEQVHGLMSRRFTLEACRLIGKDPWKNWQAPLFAALSEAVEITALQRGAERWEGGEGKKLPALRGCSCRYPFSAPSASPREPQPLPFPCFINLIKEKYNNA